MISETNVISGFESSQKGISKIVTLISGLEKCLVSKFNFSLYNRQIK